MKRRLTAFLSLAAAAGLWTLVAPTPGQAQGAAARAVGIKIDGHIEYPQFSPDGARIAYEVLYPAEKRRELWIVGWDGSRTTGEPARLVPESMTSSSRYGASKRITHGFAWAATGQYGYAYSVSDAQGAQDIYIDNWSTMIESGSSANKNPAWDPKGPRFVFSSGRSGNGDLYLWDSGEPLQLTFDADNAELYPVWNPDGKRVAYVRQGKQGSHIFLLDADAFSTLPLIQFDGVESTRPSFSPDGNKVAFFSNKGQDSVQKFGLWVTDARPGGNTRQIGAKARLPSKGTAAWTPDGKGVIAVMDDPDGGDPICIFPVDGGQPNCLTGTGTRNNRDPQLIISGSTWRLLFTSQSGRGDSDDTWQEMYTYDIPR